MKILLFDIEGTTTDIAFVHKVLFPYSMKKMEQFILNHQTHPEIQKALTQTFEIIEKEQGKRLGLYDLIDYLKFWIKTDRKIGPLKTIQGLIWDEGYAQKEFKGHIYPEVFDSFNKWIKEGYQISIYSSGSVHAQKNIFKNSTQGDLTPLISHYFDTAVGGKRESASYKNISNSLQVSPGDITFFSDIPEELLAAEAAGLNVVHVVRAGTKKSSHFKSIHNFLEFTS